MKTIELQTALSTFCNDRGVHAYLVGGCLRDGILARTSNDLDVVVADVDPIIFAKGLAQRINGRYVPLDVERGIARVVVKNAVLSQQIDVTACKGNIEEDLARRDFTINAMAIPMDRFLESDWNGWIVDPFGGRDDIEQRVLRMIVSEAFVDDPLRLLRAVRLAATLGLRIDGETRLTIQRFAYLITQVAWERLSDELLALIASSDPARWLYELDELDILVRLFPELEVGRGVVQPKEHYWDVLNHNIEAVGAVDRLLARRGEPEWVLEPIYWTPHLQGYFETCGSDGRMRSTLVKLAALFHDVAKPVTRMVDKDGRIRFLGHHKEGAVLADGITRRMRLSRRSSDLICLMIANHLRPRQMAQAGQLPTNRAVYRYFRDVGDAAIDTMFLNLGDYLAARGPLLGVEEWHEHVRIIEYPLRLVLEREPVNELPRLVNGHDLMQKMGITPGPYLGTLLDVVREAQAIGEVTTQDEAFAFIRHQIRDGNQVDGISHHLCHDRVV